MILRVYSVRDLKAAAFAPPFFLGADAVAVRTFGDAVQDPQHPMHAHPDDYQLFYLGEFNDEDGSIERAQQPVFLCNGNGEMTSNGR